MLLRSALRVLQFGAIAAVLCVSTLHVFELDRFFVPKELVLHATALVAGLLAFRAIAQLPSTPVDRLLGWYILLCTFLAMFATNRWLSLRALTVSASAIVLFWVARALREAGLARPLLGALALAVVVTAVTSLLQTYGLDLTIFSENRIPGGTLGNRNFIAHVAALGMPLVVLAAMTAQRRKFFIIGVALVTAALVLTRSRAAWLAFGAVTLVTLFAMFAAPSLRRDRTAWRRVFLLIGVLLCGAAVAIVLPNTLKWKSRNPYTQSVKGIADYQKGSGHGRLLQYEHSLMMTLHHPLLGVGPGNWAVEYPAYARPDDPSLDENERGVTTNPWPSSDWIAIVSERGPAATILLALALLGIAGATVRQLREASTADEAFAAAALLGTLAGAIVAGMFDAVLLLGLPAFLVWTAAGAIASPGPIATAQPAPRTMRPAIVLGVLALAAVGTWRSTAQLVAMNLYATHGDRATLERASRIDPGNYRLQLRLARGGKSRCEHALAAHALFPHAQPAIDASRGCR